MKTKYAICLALILVVVITGCTTIAERKKYLSLRYPDWDSEVIGKVSIGVVDIGMTRDQAREALVAPQPYYSHTEGDVWSYADEKIFTRSGPREYGKILFFENDRIVRIKRFMRASEAMIYIEWE